MQRFTSIAVVSAVLMASPAWAQERCAVGVLHFNIQYVAGGLEGMAEDLGLDSGDYDWSEQAMEDAIIRESFVPLLGLLEAHPDWTLTFEMQALMAEIMAERFPEDMERLRTLAHAGRAELASFHYSDQLFLAHPGEDMERSIQRTIAVFEELELPLSGVVFTQEGQFGEGMLPLMAEYGYDVAILPKNLFRLQHEDMASQAFFESGGLTVMVGSRSFEDPGTGSGIAWHFLDDGELVATNDLPPYLGPLFVHHEESVAAYEQNLQDRVDQGYRIAGIDDCVAQLLAAGVEREPMPPVLDGTWQPDDTDNLGLWMGGGGAWSGDDGTERDNGVLTLGTRAHKTLVAVGALLDDSGESLDDAWRELLLGQVSDSTGWNPYRTETEYSLSHLQAAIDLAAAQVAVALPEHPSGVAWLDGDGSVLAGEPADAISDDPFAAAFETDGGEREVTTETLVSGITGLPVLAVTFGEGGHAQGSPTVRFSWDGEAYRGVTALTEDVREVDTDELTCTAIGLPASLGVVGLDPDTWIVADQQTVHLAALHDRAAGTVSFVDETLGDQETASWRFHLAPTADQALAAGLLLNDRGPVAVELPLVGDDDDDDSAGGDDDDDDDGGGDCSCSAARSGRGGGPVLALVAAVLAGRRRAGARRPWAR